MKTTRREFLKMGAGAISISFLMPDFARARGQVGADRRILIAVQLTGGNDGLNTVIPYTNPRYLSLRPTLGFREAELKGDTGSTTIINDQFGFHPAMTGMKALYDEGKLAVVLGVGYPNPDLSHTTSSGIWQTASPNPTGSLGWLGRYADLTFAAGSDLSAVAIGFGYSPKATLSSKIEIPLINRVGQSAFNVFFSPEHDLILDTFRSIIKRELPPDNLIQQVSEVSASADENTGVLQQALLTYSSSVVYPPDNAAAQALKAVAILAAALPQTSIFHVQYPALFDTHAQQIGTSDDKFSDRLTGLHAMHLKNLSEGIKAFYDDMVIQGLADNFLLMTYSEFGRRPEENASAGTDHGTASTLFIVGNKVKGGDLYGLQPSLNASDFDSAGNMLFSTDFRSVYATVLDEWLQGAGSQEVLGARFPHVGFI